MCFFALDCNFCASLAAFVRLAVVASHAGEACQANDAAELIFGRHDVGDKHWCGQGIVC